MPPLDHTKCYLTAKSTLGTFIHIFRGEIDCFNCFAVREVGSISVCLGPMLKVHNNVFLLVLWDRVYNGEIFELMSEHSCKFDCFSGFAATEVNTSSACSGSMSNYVQLLPNCPNLGFVCCWTAPDKAKPSVSPPYIKVNLWKCWFKSILTFMIETSLKSEDIAALPHIM